MAEKFIQKAIKKPGSLTKMAKAKGMSIAEYCAQGNLSTLAKRRCNLWRTLSRLSKKK